MRHYTGLILGLRPASERWCYFITTSLIEWAQTWNQPSYNMPCYPRQMIMKLVKMQMFYLCSHNITD